MLEWVLNRTIDILLALLVMALLVWFVLTQPVISFAGGTSPELDLQPQQIDERLREALSIAETQVDIQSRFEATGAYLVRSLESAGSVEQVKRGDGLRILRVRIGQPFERKLFVGLHYVVTPQPIAEVMRTTVSLLELVDQLAAQKQANMYLDLTIFLHKVDNLAQGLTDASIYHVDQLVQEKKADDLGLLFAPGLRVPDVVYSSDQWRYFDMLLPSSGSDLSLFGRIRDVMSLRELKLALEQQGLPDVNSLNIPVSFPGVRDSPLKYYWDRNLAMLLVRPNVLVNDKNYDGHIKFISSMFGLVRQGS